MKSIGIIVLLLCNWAYSQEKLTTEDSYEKAYFSSGCFWCIEPIYESIAGVNSVVSGYSGGHTKNPTYEMVVTGKTGHAETVEVIYNPKVVSFKTLVDVYFASQDVTQQNGQGPDIGSQYRSIVFYQTSEEKAIIETKIQKLKNNYDAPIAAEVKRFEKFWKAESYHQNYKKKNPNVPYIKGVSEPRYKRFKKKYLDSIK